MKKDQTHKPKTQRPENKDQTEIKPQNPRRKIKPRNPKHKDKKIEKDQTERSNQNTLQQTERSN